MGDAQRPLATNLSTPTGEPTHPIKPAWLLACGFFHAWTDALNLVNLPTPIGFERGRFS